MDEICTLLKIIKKGKARVNYSRGEEIRKDGRVRLDSY